MGDNKFLEDYRYIKENNSGTGKYLIKKYNEYNSNDLLCPLLDNIEKIINIWDVCILDSLDYTIEDIDELFKQGPVMKNLDIQLCFDFLFEFKIYSKKALSRFLEKIKNYDDGLKSFLSKKIKRCIDNGIYYCDILYKKEDFKLIGLNNNYDSLYYSIINSLYYIEYGETLLEKVNIKSLSIWNKYNIVNRLVNVNGMVIPFRELVISVCQEYKTILEDNEENLEKSKYDNICFNIMSDEYIDNYINNIFDNWTSPESDVISEQYKLRLLAYYAMLVNTDFKIHNTCNTLSNLILEFDTYPNYIYNNGPCYPNTPAGIVEIVSLCSILDYNIVVLHHQDDIFYFDNNHGYSEKRENSIYLYKDDYNIYFSLIESSSKGTGNTKLRDDNYVKPQILDVKKIMEDFEKSIQDAQTKIEEQSKINSDLNSTATKKVSKKKMEQITLVLSNINSYEYRRLSKYVGIELKNIDDVNKYIDNIDYYRKIVDGIKHIKTTLAKILIEKNNSIESKLCTKYFREEILDIFKKSSNMKLLLNNLNNDEINNFGKIMKYLANNNKDIKHLDKDEKKLFILDTYLSF